jgi:hypothetical protein
MSAEVSDVSLIQDEDLLRRMVSGRAHVQMSDVSALEPLLFRFRKHPLPSFGSEAVFLHRHCLKRGWLHLEAGHDHFSLNHSPLSSFRINT